MTLTQQILDSFLGKHIRDVCPLHYADDSDNHCAHFVSHVLALQFGVTCRTMSHGTGAAASIRVQEVFPHCPQVGTWSSLPGSENSGLVFITNANNVNLATKVMTNVPRKHVGIFFGPARNIYHYSNSQRKVVKQTPTQFSTHYAAPDNAMYWGKMP
jgi:hypothetical protein